MIQILLIFLLITLEQIFQNLLITDLNDFDYVMSLNVRSVINLSKNVVAKMLNNNIKGSIINVSSQMGHVGGPNRTTYCCKQICN